MQFLTVSLIKGSFQANFTRVQNWCFQIFFKFLLFNCFYERNVSWNFNFIAQFSLTLWLFKVLGIVQKFLVCKFLWFSGSPTFRQLLLLILLELLLESRPRIVSKTSRTKDHLLKAILFTIIINSICKKKMWKVVQVTNFAMFFKLRCLLIISKAQYTSHVFQHWKTIWQVAKTLKLSYHKVVLLLL